MAVTLSGYGVTNVPLENQRKTWSVVRLLLKRDDTRAEIRFRLSTKRTSPFKSAGGSVQSTTGSRGVRISGSNAGYTMFRGSVKVTGYPLHSPVSLSLPPPPLPVRHRVPSHFSWTLHLLLGYGEILWCVVRKSCDGTFKVLPFYYYYYYHHHHHLLYAGYLHLYSWDKLCP